MHNKKILSQQYLKILYQNVITHHADELAETHGEILYESVDQLLSYLSLNNKDTFIDFGSGLGKIASYVFLNSNAKNVYGIELVPSLHQQALVAAQQIQRELPEFFLPDRQLNFLLGHFLEIDIPHATVALINSVCFNQTLMLGLGNRFNTTNSIHTILTTRPLLTLERLKLKKIIRVQCSWDTALCYIYK